METSRFTYRSLSVMYLSDCPQAVVLCAAVLHSKPHLMLLRVLWDHFSNHLQIRFWLEMSKFGVYFELIWICQKKHN